MNIVNIPVETFFSFYENKRAIELVKDISFFLAKERWRNDSANVKFSGFGYKTKSQDIKYRPNLPTALDYEHLESIRMLFQMATEYEFFDSIYNFKSFQDTKSDEIFFNNHIDKSIEKIECKESLVESLEKLHFTTPLHTTGVTFQIKTLEFKDVKQLIELIHKDKEQIADVVFSILTELSYKHDEDSANYQNKKQYFQSNRT